MKRVRKIILPFVLSVFSVLITGCVGKEPNEIAYVVALGIDMAENGNYKITIQYANPTEISGGGEESKGSGENITENVVVEAPNIYSAVNLANQVDSKNFSLSHTKLIVFSAEFAENGLGNMAEIFIGSEELRPDVYLAVSLEGAGEYLEAVNPTMEINPAKYYQLIYDKNQPAGLPEGSGNVFFFGVETGDYDTLLPLAGANNENEEENSDINKEPFEYKMGDYIAGKNPVSGGSSEAIGSAVFKGDKMVGVLGSIETEIYKLLTSDYKYSYITLYNEKSPDNPITVKLSRRKNPKYHIDNENKKVNVSIFLDGDVYSLPVDYRIEGEINKFEQKSAKYISKACENLMRKVTDEYESDIFALNEKSKIKFLTNGDYNEYKNSVDYRDFEFNVNVDFDIKRTGLVIREE